MVKKNSNDSPTTLIAHPQLTRRPSSDSTQQSSRSLLQSHHSPTVRSSNATTTTTTATSTTGTNSPSLSALPLDVNLCPFQVVVRAREMNTAEIGMCRRRFPHLCYTDGSPTTTTEHNAAKKSNSDNNGIKVGMNAATTTKRAREQKAAAMYDPAYLQTIQRGINGRCVFLKPFSAGSSRKKSTDVDEDEEEEKEKESVSSMISSDLGLIDPDATTVSFSGEQQ